MNTYPSSNSGAATDSGIPAFKANINNGTSRSHCRTTLVAEVEPGAPGDVGATLILKGTEDLIDFEAQAAFALIHWRTPDGRVYIVKAPNGEVGYATEAALDLLILDLTCGQEISISENEEPDIEPAPSEDEQLAPDDDDEQVVAVAISPSSRAEDDSAFAAIPQQGIVVQVRPGECGLLYLLTGERLTDEAFKAAHYVYSFDVGGFATVYANRHGRTGRVRASVASIDAAKALRLADRDGVRELAEETRAIFLPRRNGPSASLSDYARTFATITLWPRILDEASLSPEDLDGLISRVNDTIFHHGLKYANGSIGIQVPTSQVEVTLCGTANAPWAWPGDRTAEEIAGLGLLRALKAYRQERGERE